MISSSKHNGSIFCTSLKDPMFYFLSRQKTLNHRVNCTRVAKLKLIFPALRTPFSFQPFARSPRSQGSRVLDLKLASHGERTQSWKTDVPCCALRRFYFLYSVSAYLQLKLVRVNLQMKEKQYQTANLCFARPLRCFTGFVVQRSTASTVAKDFSTQGYCTLIMAGVLFNLTELYYVAMLILSQAQLSKEISNILAKSAVKVYARIKTLFSVHNVKYAHTLSVSVFRKGHLNIIWTTLI